ncbi:hypothetical protein SAMN05216331_11260 [Porphyromonadaceae bacterium KH3R12]|nr:hypothetical protein SAMN05216331_11260 [Porphyromonadaceae bacterium KH3R12]
MKSEDESQKSGSKAIEISKFLTSRTSPLPTSNFLFLTSKKIKRNESSNDNFRPGALR